MGKGWYGKEREQEGGNGDSRLRTSGGRGLQSPGGSSYVMATLHRRGRLGTWHGSHSGMDAQGKETHPSPRRMNSLARVLDT